MTDRPQTSAAAPTRGWGAVVERSLLVAGAALLATLVYRAGPAAVWRNLALVGWGFVFTIGQELFAATFNTLGWRYAFPAGERPPFRRLLAARIVGDGVNAVTPTATIGGEWVRGRFVEGFAEPTAVWASIAVAKISQSVAQVVFIVVGLLFVLAATPLPAGLRTALVAVVGGFAAVVALAVVLQRRGLFTAGFGLARRLGLPAPSRIGERLTHLDREIAGIYDEPWSFALSVTGFWVGWLFGLLEIYLLLHFLDAGASLPRALTIETFSVTIDAVLFFVPAKAGTQEGGKMLIFQLLGLDPTKGLALGLARRIRELTWAGVGLTLLARDQVRRGRS